ncbi:DUF3558 domain-containing protein [Streptomyces sp. NBC_00162]|uniref:DUF3558 domain-containing protein n=1 Tax=Streptomyces sp. NBC_00162 TaxID=2903629 RepID=UPI00214B6CC9|nr:DUF3558 domain-containing protein [Streptomyces sp. NBC_00162]UUU39260.1 DUF3558 domain-containing protein [Streptomyces sp. NBC_00162]
MTSWDEDSQAWVEAGGPAGPDGPPPGERTRRMSIVVITAALLAAAAGAGIWALVHDGGGGGDAPDPAPPAATGVLADPCDAVDSDVTGEWKLDSPDPDRRDEIPMRACSWTSDRESVRLLVMYSRDIPLEPKPTPTSVPGVRSAMVSGNAKGCVILWPTSFGKALVMAQQGTGSPDRNVCDIAADFAEAVAPEVPG